MPTVDKLFCASSFLAYRALVERDIWFSGAFPPYFFTPSPSRFHIRTVRDIDAAIAEVLGETLAGGPSALMLSGGIDSAILAKYLPAGTIAYTLRCVADGALDETEQAKQYAAACGLVHQTVDVTWEDYRAASPLLMRHKGAPVHSIEPQIYMAGLAARRDGVENLIFGENADIIFGGMDGLLAEDWTFDRFVRRYTYLDPARILRGGVRILEPFQKYRRGGGIDFYGFLCDYFYAEANGSYGNACAAAGVRYVSPFNRMVLDTPLDYARIRGGESKYMLRELFRQKYGTDTVPPKTPLPRAVKQWLGSWDGPVRGEFLPGCAEGLTADQKWMVYILEQFLDMLDEPSSTENPLAGQANKGA